MQYTLYQSSLNHRGLLVAAIFRVSGRDFEDDGRCKRLGFGGCAFFAGDPGIGASFSFTEAADSVRDKITVLESMLSTLADFSVFSSGGTAFGSDFGRIFGVVGRFASRL